MLPNNIKTIVKKAFALHSFARILLKLHATMNASLFSELNELNERFKLPRWTDRERRVFKVVSIPQLSGDQETVAKEFGNLIESANAAASSGHQSGSTRDENLDFLFADKSENDHADGRNGGDREGGDRDGGDRDGGDRDGGDRDGGDRDGGDQDDGYGHRQLSAPPSTFSERVKKVLDSIRGKNPRFTTAFFFITDDPRSAPILQAPKFRARKVQKDQREKARQQEILKRIAEGVAQHKNITDERIEEKWAAFKKSCPYELRQLDDKHFFGTEKQQISQQSKTIQVLRAQNQCVDVMCKDAATCLFCPAGHGYCDDCGEGFLDALKTGAAEDRCNHVDPVTLKRCCEYLTKDEVDKSGRRVRGTSCYGAVARVVHLQEERAEKQQNKRRRENARQDNDALIIDEEFVRSAMNTLVTPCCGKAYVPENVEHCLAMKCGIDAGGCGKNFCGVCLDKAHVTTPGEADCHSIVRECAFRYFGNRNVFRNCATSEQWKKHYANVAKKNLRELIKARANALAGAPIFE